MNPQKSSPIVGLTLRINCEPATIAQGLEKGFGGTRRRVLTRLVSLKVGMPSVAGLVRVRFGMVFLEWRALISISPESRQPFSVPAMSDER